MLATILAQCPLPSLVVTEKKKKTSPHSRLQLLLHLPLIDILQPLHTTLIPLVQKPADPPLGIPRFPNRHQPFRILIPPKLDISRLHIRISQVTPHRVLLDALQDPVRVTNTLLVVLLVLPHRVQRVVVIAVHRQRHGPRRGEIRACVVRPARSRRHGKV